MNSHVSSPPLHPHPLDPVRVSQARARLPDREDTDRLAGVMAMLADPTRARVLYALDAVEELCVGDLALACDVNQDAASYALRLLRIAGLVTNRRQGRIVYYRLADGYPEPLCEKCLHRLTGLARAPASPRQPTRDAR